MGRNNKESKVSGEESRAPVAHELVYEHCRDSAGASFTRAYQRMTSDEVARLKGMTDAQVRAIPYAHIPQEGRTSADLEAVLRLREDRLPVGCSGLAFASRQERDSLGNPIGAPRIAFRYIVTVKRKVMDEVSGKEVEVEVDEALTGFAIWQANKASTKDEAFGHLLDRAMGAI